MIIQLIENLNKWIPVSRAVFKSFRIAALQMSRKVSETFSSGSVRTLNVFGKFVWMQELMRFVLMGFLQLGRQKKRSLEFLVNKENGSNCILCGYTFKKS